MDSHRLAFRRSLEQGSLSNGTVRQYVTAAGRLLKFCDGKNYELYRGDVPGTLLEEFNATLTGSNVRRLLRGAGLFVEFLAANRDVPLPPLSGPRADHLDREQLGRFMQAAAEEPEPYATLLRMLPMSGLRSSELSKLTVDQVLREEEQTSLRVSDEQVVKLGREAHELLGQFLDGWRATFELESTALFPSSSGRSLGASSISRRLAKLQKTANLHDFRISALSDLYAIHFKPAHTNADHQDQEGAPAPSPRTPPLAGLPDDEGPVAPPEPLPADNSDARAGPPSEDRVDHDDDNYHHPHPSPPPKTKRQSSPRNYASKEVAKILPKAGSVVIRKRFDGGRLGYIGQYQVTDFGEEGAIEPFIHRHLLPQYGGGDYLIYKNALTDKPLHVVHILAPQRETGPTHLAGPQNHTAADLLREHLDAAKVLKDATSGGNPAELVNAVWRIATLQGQGARSNDEIRRLREDVEQLRQALLMPPGGSPLGSPLGPGLPHTPAPAPPSPESTLTQALLKQFLDNAQRDRERLHEFYRQANGGDPLAKKPPTAIEHIRETKQVADAVQDLVGPTGNQDKLDRLLDIIAGPIGMKVGEWAMNAGKPAPSKKKKKKKSSLNGSGANGAAHDPREELPRSEIPTDVPDHFVPYARKMDEAESEEELIESMMFGLASLSLDPPWKPAVRRAFQGMLNDRKTETLILTWDLLEALAQHGHIEFDTARMAITICKEQWAEVREQVIKLLKQRAAG